MSDLTSDDEPQPPIDVKGSRGLEATYGGRNFYGIRASDLAELTYLRDWQRWARIKLLAIKLLKE
jgi:hypothetical protein